MQNAVRTGRVRILGVSIPSTAFPDAPIITTDVPGYDNVSWFGMFAPRGTSRDVVTRIRDDVAAVLKLPDVKRRLLDIGGEPGGTTPEEFAARVRNEIAK